MKNPSERWGAGGDEKQTLQCVGLSFNKVRYQESRSIMCVGHMTVQWEQPTLLTDAPDGLNLKKK